MDSNTSTTLEANTPCENVVISLNKRPRANSTSSEQHLTKLQKLTGDNCGHCKKKCTSRGKFSEALQCDLCYTWVHAQCEGISKDQYKITNQIGNEVPGITYFCKLNNCCSRFKQLLFSFVSSSTSISSAPVDTEASDSVMNLATLSSKCDNVKETLHKSITELSLKVDRLLSCNSDLQMDINSASEQIDASANTKVNTATAPTLGILDELADRERRRKNLIAYNFPENGDSPVDKTKFQELSTTVFNLDLSITKVYRLGKRKDDKPRPLLIGLESETEKAEILSQSGKLRRYDQYNDVYIVADKTKYERDKHKKLVDELKLRRSKGERNLVIRNGSIITSVPRPRVPTDQPPSKSPSDSSSRS